VAESSWLPDGWRSGAAEAIKRFAQSQAEAILLGLPLAIKRGAIFFWGAAGAFVHRYRVGGEGCQARLIARV
jgi:hypothetical protein